MIPIVGISGSLRAKSSNTVLLRAAANLASSRDMSIIVYSALGELPHFNPDLEGREPPSVIDFRTELARADALLISSPEYAHGVPGSLKNALDWLVSGPEMPGKPVGLLNASARSLFAHAQLAETLRTMSARVSSDTVALIPLDARRLTATEIAEDPELSSLIRRAIEALAKVAGF